MATNPYLSLVQGMGNEGSAPQPANPYKQAVQEDLLRETSSSLAQATNVNADTDAKLQSLAQQYNIPLSAVRLEPQAVERRAALDAANPNELVKNNPGTASFLANPQNAALAHDDVQSLKGIEDANKEYGYWSAAKKGAYTFKLTWDFLADQLAGSLGFDQTETRNIMAVTAAEIKTLGSDPQMDAALKAAKERGGDTWYGTLYNLPGTIIEQDDPLDVLGKFATEQLVGSLPAFGVGAAASKPLQGYVSSKIANELIAKGVNTAIAGAAGNSTAVVLQSLGSNYQEGIDRGLTTDESVQRAWKKTLAEVPANAIAGMAMGLRIGPNHLTNVIGQAVAQGAGGGIGAAQASIAVGEPVDSGEVALEILGEGITAVPEVGGLTLDAVVTRAREQARKVREAEEAAKVISKVADLAKGSKLAQRSPETFEAFMQSATANGPVQDVYLNPQQAQDAGIDLIALAGVSPSVEAQLQTALDTGQDIKIPVSEFAARIATSDQAQGITDYLKTDPKAMTRAEAAEFAQKQQELFQEEVKKIEAEKATNEAWQASVEEVKADLRQKLAGANRFTKDVNEEYLVPYAAYTQVRAAQLGMTPMEFHQQYGLRDVSSQMPTGEASFGQQFTVKPPKVLYRGVKAEGGTGVFSLGKGVYSTPNKKMAAQFGDVQELAPESAYPRKPLVLTGSAGAQDLFKDWIFKNSTFKNIREFNKAYPDPGAFVREKGYDGVVAGDEVVWYGNVDSGNAGVGVLRDGSVRGLSAPSGSGTSAQTGNEGTGELNQSTQPPQFFSALQRSIEGLNQPKGSPEQWAGIIKNLTQKGVKQEEIDWTGVQDWLKEQKGSVTKEQVLDYLRANEIRVDEVVKSEDTPVSRDFTVREFNGDYEVLDNEGTIVRTFGDAEEAANWVEENATAYDSTDNTKFGKYTLPGGAKYRELLMTLPTTSPLKAHTDYLDKLTAKYGVGRDKLEGVVTDEEAARVKDLASKRGDPVNDYRSSHYDEPNILAHIRFNERTDADGKRVMFVEEVQSDWHQAGRDKGYKITAKERARADDLMRMADEAGGIDNLAPELQTEARALGKRLVADGVPDAPFKTSWPELAFKRALMWAVENNFDRVAWTTGEQQAERYDLSKQVDYIQYQPIEDSDGAIEDYAVRAVRDGEVVLDKDVSAKELPDLVGKEVAEKIINGEGKENTKLQSPDGLLLDGKLLEGIDLKVGGEGMKGFYDKMLPSMVNKLVKKWDGKVGQTTIAPEGARRIASSMSAEDRAAYFADIKQREGGEAVADVWSLDITPAMRESIQQGLPLFQQNRGSYSPQERLIRLLNASDLTTFNHELAHYFLDIDTQLAARPDAPDAIKKDVDTVLKWFEFEGGTPEARLAKWQSMSVDEQRPYHEQFAESFERYTFEGKAPSLEMREVFKRFSAWAKSVYRSLERFLADNPDAGKLNDEVRGVFDRMLATSEQIKEAEAAASMTPLFTDAQAAGMTDEQFTEYRELDVKALTDADAQLTSRSLRDMKWLSNAKGKALKALQAQADEKRKAVRQEVTDEVMAEPVNRARQFLKRGLINGETVEGPTKLYIPEVEALYGENPAIGSILEKLGYGKYGMLAKENGIHPDQVAELFGFKSGRELIDTLISAEDPQEKIVGLTDQRMLERYGDLTDQDALERAAEEAVHNEARMRFVATEMAALQNAMGSVRDIERAAKNAAQSALGQVKVKDINPNRYITAAARASREAEKAIKAGNRQEAVNAKRKQLFNLAMAREAFAARSESETAVRGFRKLFRSDKQMSKYYDMKLVAAARAVLGSYGIGGEVNAAQALADLKLVGDYDPEMYEQIEPVVNLALQAAGDYRQLPYSEFKAMVDSVNQIAHSARRTKQIRIDGQLVDKKVVVDALRERMQEIGVPVALPGEVEAVTDAQRRKWTIQGLRASARRVESWVDGMDGNVMSGPFRKYVWQPVSNAVTDYRSAKNRVLKEYITLLRAKQKEFGQSKIAASEIGYTFENKNELLGALLHIGNESNKRKLLLGRKWGEERVNALGEKVLDTSRFESFLKRAINEGTLTKSDFDFLQATWDLMESIKGDAQKAHYDMYGYYFNEITADPIKTPFGEYRGGYAPAVADRELVQDAAIKQEANAIEEGFNYMMPSTATGFTKGRVEYNRPLQMDLRLVASHIDQVLRFTYVQPAVRDALRIVRSNGFANTLNKLDNAAVTDLLMPWLHRSARQLGTQPFQGTAGKAVGKFLRTLRARTGMVTMTANFVNAFQQITGFTMAAVKVKPRYLKAALLNYVKNPNANTETVKSLSPWMANRLDNEIFELQSALDNILEDQTRWQQAREFSQKHAYFLQRSFQNVVDVVAWQGAYNEALETMTEKEAVQYADSVVRQTQGSTAPEDMARFESGNAFYQLFTQFAGYFNMQANLLGTEFKKTFKDTGIDKGRAAYVYAMGFMLPAVIADAIVRSFGWDWDDEDDDGYLDELTAWFFGSQIRNGVAMFPFVGNVANSLFNRFNSQPFDDRISTAPTVSVLESAVNAPFSVYKAVGGDGKTSRAIGDSLTLLTLVTGVPFSAVSRPAKYTADMAQGRVDPENPADLARGLVTGRGREDERK